MAITLSGISLLSRIIFMCGYIFYFSFYTFTTNIIIATLNYSIFTLVPTVAIFVFYFFNKKFRQEFDQRILRKSKRINDNTTNTMTSTQRELAATSAAAQNKET